MIAATLIIVNAIFSFLGAATGAFLGMIWWTHKYADEDDDE